MRGLILAILGAVPVYAGEGQGPPADRHELTAGSFFSGQNPAWRPDSTVGERGTTINFEDDLAPSAEVTLFSQLEV